MKTRVIRIGNTRGIRIPKVLLEGAGLKGEVDVSVEHNSLVIRPATNPRAGWAEAFREMAKRGDDALLDGDTPSLTSWDEEEWEWQ